MPKQSSKIEWSVGLDGKCIVVEDGVGVGGPGLDEVQMAEYLSWVAWRRTG